MIEKNVFSELAERIVAEVAAIKRVDLNMGQLETPENWDAINNNTVLIDFGDTPYSPLSGDCYDVRPPCTLYIIEENVTRTELDTNEDDAYINTAGLSVMDLAKLVMSAVVKRGYTYIGRVNVLNSSRPQQRAGIRYVAIGLELAYRQGF